MSYQEVVLFFLFVEDHNENSLKSRPGIKTGLFHYCQMLVVLLAVILAVIFVDTTR